MTMDIKEQGNEHLSDKQRIKTELDFINYLAVSLLDYFKVAAPDQQAISNVEFYLKYIMQDFFSPDLGHNLSKQERACFRLYAEGKGHQEIMELLHRSDSSVRHYKDQIRKKFKVKSTGQAVLKAFRIDTFVNIVLEQTKK